MYNHAMFYIMSLFLYDLGSVLYQHHLPMEVKFVFLNLELYFYQIAMLSNNFTYMCQVLHIVNIYYTRTMVSVVK